jgi:hypothetical protein
MSLVRIRKKSLTVETTFHELGPEPATPLKMAAAAAVVANPYAGRYVEDLLPFMQELRSLGHDLAEELVETLGGKENVEVYSKAAIVGLNGEMEHGAVWHEAGGWAMRQVLGQPKAIVPVHYIHACYVRSHFNSIEVGIQDAPRPDEILFALVMGTSGRLNPRLGGLMKEDIKGEDGQR